MTLAGIIASIVAGVVGGWPYLSGEVGRAYTRASDATGRLVKLPPLDAFGRQTPSGDYALVYAGTCDSCSLQSVSIPDLSKRAKGPVCVVYSGALSETVQREARVSRVYVYQLPGWELTSGLEPRWVGHWYLVREGRVERQASSARESLE